jgi:uncharacterized phage protein (TIGR02218 family)
VEQYSSGGDPPVKNLDPDFQAHINGQTTTLCTCWHLIREDGVELGFSDHNKDLTIDGLLYKAATGFTATSVESKADFSVDNMDLEGMLTSDEIAETDILNGRYDYAEVEIFMVNYADLSLGRSYVKRGRMGEVKVNRSQFIAELRGLSQHLQQTIGRVYTSSCDAILGDARCAKDLAAFTFTGTITSVTDRQKFKCSTLTQDAGFFTGGAVTFTSGDNDGLKMEVKEFNATEVVLALPMPNTIQASDTFSIVAGCDKTAATCIAKFANFINFRGFPDIPGMDAILETAGTADLRR